MNKHNNFTVSLKMLIFLIGLYEIIVVSININILLNKQEDLIY